MARELALKEIGKILGDQKDEESNDNQ